MSDEFGNIIFLHALFDITLITSITNQSIIDTHTHTHKKKINCIFLIIKNTYCINYLLLNVKYK